jgi:hypothetical protein
MCVADCDYAGDGAGAFVEQGSVQLGPYPELHGQAYPGPATQYDAPLYGASGYQVPPEQAQPHGHHTLQEYQPHYAMGNPHMQWPQRNPSEWQGQGNEGESPWAVTQQVMAPYAPFGGGMGAGHAGQGSLRQRRNF